MSGQTHQVRSDDNRGVRTYQVFAPPGEAGDYVSAGAVLVAALARDLIEGDRLARGLSESELAGLRARLAARGLALAAGPGVWAVCRVTA